MSDKLDQLLEGFYSFKKDIEANFASFENRFDNLENRFDNLENRFDNLENRFDHLENRFDNLEEKVNETNKIVRDIKRTQITNRRQIAENTLDISDIKEKLKIS